MLNFLVSFFTTFFASPLYLLLLPVVPLVLWRWWRRARPAFRYPNAALLAALPAGRGSWARRGGLLLRGAGLVCLVLGLAGMRWPDRSTRIPTEGIAIEILVDVSGSMAEPDFDWQGTRISRLEAVKRAFRLFVAGGDGPDGEHLDGRPDDLIGLLVFARRPDPTCPLTLSHSVLLRLLDEEKPRSVPGECETNITDALLVGLKRLHGAHTKRKVLILLSDGEHNVPDTASEEVRTPRQAAQIAANLGIPVHTIDAGGDTTSSDLEPGVRTDATANREAGIRTLQEVANITRGQYFQARDTKGLIDVCRRIDALERDPIQSFQYRRYFDAFAWLGTAALALLLGVHILELTVWRRLP